MYAAIFPGQGSQFVGMGKNLYDSSKIAQNIFDTADNVLQEYCKQNHFQRSKFSEIIFNGPSELLNETSNTQIAIFITSAAMLENIQSEFSTNVCVAGHSLGEYTALYAAGILSFEDVLDLLQKRGSLMSKAKNGSMLALLGARDKIDQIIEIGSKSGICVIANDNCEGQIVISGSSNAIDSAEEYCKEEKIKAIRLNVSGGFHSPLMEDAQREFSHEIDRKTFSTPKMRFFSSVSAMELTDKDQIKELLSTQLTSQVKWRQTMQEIMKSVNNQNWLGFIEVGPGTVLSGLARRDGHTVCSYEK